MDTARHRGPEPPGTLSGADVIRPPGPVGPTVGEQRSADLWSLPLEPPEVTATDSARLVEAWMDALAPGPVVPGAAPASTERIEPAVSPAPRGHPEPSPRAPRVRSTGWRAVLAAIILIPVVSTALLALVAVSSGGLPTGARTPAGSVTTPTDDRVVVPGPSADCPMWLVKPRPDGSTVGVPGTCFVVG